MIYCRPGPGCTVHAWRSKTGYGYPAYFLRFGSALEDMSLTTGKELSTCNLNLFADALAALRRAGFLIPDSAFERLDAEVKERDEAIAAEKARQLNMFPGVA